MRGWDIIFQDPAYLDNFPVFKEKINSCTDMWRTQWVVKSIVSMIENNLAIVDNCRNLESYKQTALAKLLHYKWSLKHMYFFSEKYSVKYADGCLGNFVGLFNGIWDDTSFTTWKKVSTDESFATSGSSSVDVNKHTKTISLAETSEKSEAEISFAQTDSTKDKSYSTSQTVVTSTSTVSRSDSNGLTDTESVSDESEGLDYSGNQSQDAFE